MFTMKKGFFNILHPCTDMCLNQMLAFRDHLTLLFTTTKGKKKHMQYILKTLGVSSREQYGLPGVTLLVNITQLMMFMKQQF